MFTCRQTARSEKNHRKYQRHVFPRLACSISVALLIATFGGCGGGEPSGEAGGSIPAPGVPPSATVITKDNYIDVAGLAIVAGNRIMFIVDVIDAAFEAVIGTGDRPGTYPCVYGGTVAFSTAGTSYTFNVSNCDTAVGGRRTMLVSGAMRVDNPVVQTTAAGWFLTSAAISFDNAVAIEAGTPSTFAGSGTLSSTVVSPTRAVGTTRSSSLSVERAGRTDAYTDVDVVSDVTLSGNSVRSGSMTLASPRAPGLLSIVANVPTTTSSATDRSQSVFVTADGVNYTLRFALDGVDQETTNGNSLAGPLALAIARALQ